MARNPDFRFSVTFVDVSGESSRLSVPCAASVDLGAAFIVGQAAYDFLIATEAISSGTVVSVAATDTRKMDNAYVGSGQREDKILVLYEDLITLALYTFEVPCRLQNAITNVIVGTDNLDMTVAPYAAFVTSAEAFVRSPDGNQINILNLKYVGRNA